MKFFFVCERKGNVIILLIIKENIEALTFQYHELILEISIS